MFKPAPLGASEQQALTGLSKPPVLRVVLTFYNLFAIVSLIGEKIVSIYSFDKILSLAAIRSGTFSDKYSDRHTMRIHGQMYLGVEPPFVRAIA